MLLLFYSQMSEDGDLTPLFLKQSRVYFEQNLPKEKTGMLPETIAAAWDARDRLLEELKQENRLPVRTLYVRRDDGGTLD